MRVENVVPGGAEGLAEWTKVLETSEGRGVRADYRCVTSIERERYSWEQQIEGTPFERHLRAMRVEIELSPAGGSRSSNGVAAQAGSTDVEISVKQVLRGLSRLGSPAMRRAQARMLDEALDGIDRALGGGTA
jgi:UDP-N-acetylmuramyl pentapeptide synthase